MTLTVLSVAYSVATVAANAVGGAEQVLARIDRGLVEAGHASIVVACDGSRVRGRLESTPSRDRLDPSCWPLAHAAHRVAIERILEREDVDIVHLHGLDFHSYFPAADVPVLTTLHLPIAWYPPAALMSKHVRFNCVSHTQRADAAHVAGIVGTIENGVDFPPSPVRSTDRGYVAMLGRICPEKGFHIAIDAARRAGVPIVLGGRVFPFPEHLRYFDDEIVPRLSDTCRFLGVMGPDEKHEMLANARCLLVPSLVAETSSLVAMEALACGTPVIAFANGALPEIVDHGVTGYIVHDEREMADAIVAVGALSPEACRAVAAERFSATRMVSEYTSLYERIVHEARSLA